MMMIIIIIIIIIIVIIIMPLCTGYTFYVFSYVINGQ